MIFRVNILAFFLFALSCKIVVAVEIQFDRAELKQFYVDGMYNFSEFRVSKFNHTAYALNVRGEFYRDIDQDFKVEIEYYYNRMNNNQYTKSIIRVPRLNLCGALDKYYSDFGMKEMKGHSNLPQYEPPAKFCPMEKVN